METYGIEKFGIIGPKAVYRNLTPAQLTEAALRLGEGKLGSTGALVVTTGKYTGRSPKDKFIVDTESIHNEIAWGKVNPKFLFLTVTQALTKLIPRNSELSTNLQARTCLSTSC